MENNLSMEMQNAIQSLDTLEVKELVQKLAKYNLGIALPHIHNNENVEILPTGKIQYENNLNVSFLSQSEFEENNKNGYPVGWRWNESKKSVEAYAWCHSE
jgi:hypothetical protein